MEDFWVNLSTKLGNNLRIEKMGNRLGEAYSHFSINRHHHGDGACGVFLACISYVFYAF